jgi:hypothetical protein
VITAPCRSGRVSSTDAKVASSSASLTWVWDSTRPSVWSKTATSLVWPSPVARCRTPESGVVAMDVVGHVVTYWEHPVAPLYPQRFVLQTEVKLHLSQKGPFSRHPAISSHPHRVRHEPLSQKLSQKEWLKIPLPYGF